jgi:hypothetical protein
MLPPERNSQVRVEDLLRLKALERPDPEFWSRFERELHQKQLTALVHKRRWWHELPVVLSRRVYVPAGAAAAVAFALVTVRYSIPVAHIENTAPRIAASDPAVEMLPVTEVTDTNHANVRHDEVAAPVRISRHDPAPASVAVSRVDMTESVGLLPVSVGANETESPSARSIAANLARLEQSEPELVNAVMGSRLTPARVMTATADVSSEDEGMDSAKRYRLIARYADHSLSPEPSAPVLFRERLARRLGDDITERISRVGVEGSRVSLKF